MDYRGGSRGHGCMLSIGREGQLFRRRDQSRFLKEGQKEPGL